MTDRDALELINAALDGELDNAGRAELEALLHESPDAGSLLREMQEFADTLERVPLVEPPAELRSRILAGVELPGAARPASRPSLAFPWHKAAGFGLSFAAGALLAVGVYSALGNSGGVDDLDQLVGTMAGVEGSDRTRGRQMRFEADPLRGNAELSATDGILLLQFRIDSPEPFAVELDLSAQPLEFRGFVRADSNSSLTESGTDFLRVEARARSHFALALSQRSPLEEPLRFEVLMGDEAVAKGEFDAVR